MSDPNKGRIAIKFGASSSSSTASKKPPSRPPPTSSLGKRPRSHAALGGESDSDSDHDHDDRGRHEAITGFGSEGAETERKRRAAVEVKKELVIARQGNKDWRTEMRAQRRGGKNLLPSEARTAQQQNGGMAERAPADQDKGLQWGLTIKERTDTVNEPTDDKVDGTENEITTASRNEPEPERPQRTADDEAIDALLGKKTQPEKTILAAPSEDDVYQRDAAQAGAASTLEDYEAMPVEEFGAALLRGMGWDGKPRGQTKEVRRRANRLGLGAKELKNAEDLGGWNQGSGGKKKSRPRLNEYRREESKRKEGRGRDDSYKRERERERERDRHGDRGRDYNRDRDRDRDRHRGYDRDRRR